MENEVLAHACCINLLAKELRCRVGFQGGRKRSECDRDSIASKMDLVVGSVCRYCECNHFGISRSLLPVTFRAIEIARYDSTLRGGGGG